VSGDLPPGPEEEVPLELDESMLAEAPAAPRDPRADFEAGMSYAPWVSLGLTALCVVVFGWEIATGALDSTKSIVQAGALSRPEVMGGEHWRLLSAIVLHGGIDHLIGNMLALYVLGVALEHAVGRERLLLLFVGSGIAGSVASITAEPGPSVGASGAIFGMMGALIVLLHRYRDVVHVRDRRVGVVLIAWAAWTLLLGLADPFIDNAAHLGGLIGGAGLAFVVRAERFERAAT
jgi:rhomboid protease GluP